MPDEAVYMRHKTTGQVVAGGRKALYKYAKKLWRQRQDLGYVAAGIGHAIADAKRFQREYDEAAVPGNGAGAAELLPDAKGGGDGVRGDEAGVGGGPAEGVQQHPPGEVHDIHEGPE